MTPRLTLLSLVSASVIARARAYNVHTVFCAECSDNFDYKSIGVYWSHALSGMPGNVTRLLACDEHQLAHYKGLNLGPTFVHKNHGRITHKRDEAPTPLKYESGNAAPFGSRPSDSSPSYNKPASIMHWALESEEAKYVDYVLYIDADMLLRLPMDPIKMGVKKGVVVSEHVGYLDVGIRNKLAFQFLPEDQAHWAGDDLDKIGFEPEGKKHASAGWYHFFHMDDIRQIAPRWLHYCEQMRLNPQLYWKMMDPNTGRPGGTDHDIVTGDAYVGHGQAPWISEMYGYVFAASEAKLKHILTHGVVVYPDEIGAGQPQEPSIIHYGLHCSVGSFHFTKYTHGNFNAVGCTGDLFGDPPQPSHLERLCSETVLTLNDAMCFYYLRPSDEGGCGHAALRSQCPAWKQPRERTCADKDGNCKLWSGSGECDKNPGFMTGACPKSCGQCDAQKIAAVPAWSRGLALSHGEEAPHMRPVQPVAVAWEEGYPAGQAHPDAHVAHEDHHGGGGGGGGHEAEDPIGRAKDKGVTALTKELVKEARHALKAREDHGAERAEQAAVAKEEAKDGAKDGAKEEAQVETPKATVAKEATTEAAEEVAAGSSSPSSRSKLFGKLKAAGAPSGERPAETLRGSSFDEGELGRKRQPAAMPRRVPDLYADAEAGAAGGKGLAARRQAAEEPAAASEHDGHPGSSSSEGAEASPLDTLKWQMYLGWVAILGLCGAIVGRRFCGRGKKGKFGASHQQSRRL